MEAQISLSSRHYPCSSEREAETGLGKSENGLYTCCIQQYTYSIHVEVLKYRSKLLKYRLKCKNKGLKLRLQVSESPKMGCICVVYRPKVLEYRLRMEMEVSGSPKTGCIHAVYILDLQVLVRIYSSIQRDTALYISSIHAKSPNTTAKMPSSRF